MSCGALFRFDPEFHAQNRAAINDMVEHGGNIQLDFDTMTIYPAENKTGGYNFIQMPRGAVDWHSHPRKCKNRNVCAIGLPSPADMINITLGAMHGTSAHAVYATEGTYIIQLRRELVEALQSNPCYLHMYCKRCKIILEKLH